MVFTLVKLWFMRVFTKAFFERVEKTPALSTRLEERAC